MAPVPVLLRFFHVVPPNPPLMLVALIVTTTAGCVTLAIDPARGRDVLTPVLLLQLFASSSGVMVPARRGHYDLLLTLGHGRIAVAVVHWATSVLPGVGSWLLLAGTEIVMTSGSAHVLFTTGTAAAVVLVSTVPWAVTVNLPRFAAAIGWLLALALAVMVVPAHADGRLFGALGGGSSWMEAAAALLLYPPLLVGEDLTGAQAFLVLPALALAAGCMAYALAWIDRHDIPLEAAQ